jgi:protein O-mannosyl-transferase
MRSVISICIALVVLTLLVYWQVGNHEFINLDDNHFIADNVHVTTGVNQPNVISAFIPVPGIGWFPITFLSHMADVQMYGLNPRGHHLTNVFFHIASTHLLFILLFRLTTSPWKSAFVAALFALHPLHVESVAWMAERRDVLSAFFGFLTLIIYAEYVTKRKPLLYFLSIFTFVLGLMSKPMLVTLPAIMLLLDFWPLNRYVLNEKMPGEEIQRVNSTLTSIFKEKIPFFVCSLISSIISINGPIMDGAVQPIDLPLGLRMANATTAYIKYIGKMFWPTDLAVYYPFPPSIPLWQVICSLLILMIITAVFIRAGKRQPYLIVGWFWFLITLLPVIGLIQFGDHAIADRYTYLPLTGLFIVVAWGIPEFTKRLQYQLVILTLFAAITITISMALTWQQLKYWQNSISLYRQTLRVTDGSFLVHNNLGAALAEKGQLDEAMEEYKKALAIKPDDYMAHNNYGLALAGKGQIDMAIVEFRRAIVIHPNSIDSYNNLGIALAYNGHLEEAINEFLKALAINPDDERTRNNYGRALELQKGDGKDR